MDNINFGAALVKSSIEKALGTKTFKIEYENFNNCILITNAIKDNEDPTYIWIRILGSLQTGVHVELSNVTFSTYLRHRGLFTRLFNAIVNTSYVTRVEVTNVVTSEMHTWCIKHGLSMCSDYTSYYFTPTH